MLAYGGGGAEQPRMAGNAPERVGVFVVDLSDEKTPAPFIDLGGRRSPEPERRWIELHVFNDAHLGAQRVEPRRQRLIIIEDESQQHESQIAIHRLTTGGVLERHGTYGPFELLPPAILTKERRPSG